MRRFLTRLAVGGNGAPRETEDGVASQQEKVALSSPSNKGQVDAGERVRALTARYESLKAPSATATGGGESNGDGLGNSNGDTTSPVKARGAHTWLPAQSQSNATPTTPNPGVDVAPQWHSQRNTSRSTRRERSPLFSFNKPLPGTDTEREKQPKQRHREGDSSKLDRSASATGGISSAVPQLPEPVILPSLDSEVDRLQILRSAGGAMMLDVPKDTSVASNSRRGSRDESGGTDLSQNAASSLGLTIGTSSSQVPTKTVAFAPSPKKPARPASPESSAGHVPVAMPSFAGGDLNAPAGVTASASSSNNFAKPTLASSARARLGGKQFLSQGSSSQPLAAAAAASSPSPGPTGSSGGGMVASSSMSVARLSQGSERFPYAAQPATVSGSRGPSSSSANMASSSSVAAKMRRSNSTGARRATSASGLVTSGQQGDGMSRVPSGSSGTANFPQGAMRAGGGSASQGEASSMAHPLPNSIPFVSSSALVALRSASPQSMATGSAGSAMGGSVVPDFFSNPRRASFQGRHHSGGSSHACITASSSVRSIGAPSWSEMTQDDLVSNLGSRERTRQEVLWEIVASEERYVQELEKTKEFFIEALLHPHRFSPPGSPGAAHAATLAALEGRNAPQKQEKSGKGRRKDVESAADEVRTDATAIRRSNATTNGDLPIAARFMSASSSVGATAGPLHYGSIDAAALSHATSQRNAEGQSPYSVAYGHSTPSLANRPRSVGASANGPGTFAPISGAAAGQSKKGNGKGIKRWSQARRSDVSSQVGYDLTDGNATSLTLPLPLRIVLEAIDNGIYEGHALLSEALRVRYEEQWPLVRSLADVFTRFGYVLKHYKSYVLNLERALDCLEEAALMERALRGKRLRKDRLSASVALGRAVASLEATAAERGECGLAIFLAMPFQRLLKYPLLFQNLLFHTDASTFEFENTVKMVVDVERIVRSIEDEKVNKEERDKTIDAFARIEGIKDRALLRPKADRVLIEERATYQENPRRAISESNDSKGDASSTAQDTLANTAMSTPLGVGSGNLRASIRSKRSYRRLSDLLTMGQAAANTAEDGGSGTPSTTYTKAPNLGSKRDIWFVRFSDVELRCQRVGVTALPMVSGAALSPDQEVHKSARAQDDEEQMQEEEERMRDEIKRSRESKERLRALRNTTLRSKTRNLYKFLGVSSWKVTRERPNLDDADGIDGLATAHEEEEEDEEFLEEDEEEDDEDDESDGGGGDSDTSQETDGGLLDPEHYIRQSKLSFSYGGLDRVEPKLTITAAGSATSSRSMLHRGFSSSGASTMRSNGRLTGNAAATSFQQKRHSMGSSASHGAAALSMNTPSSMTSLASGPSNLTSTRGVVASSKLRADKFGSRLRAGEGQPWRRGSMTDAVSSDSGHAATDAAHPGLGRISGKPVSSKARTMTKPTSSSSEIEKEDDEQDQTAHTHASEGEFGHAPALLDAPSPGLLSSSSRPSFVRDQSLDSNLYMMGRLVVQGEGTSGEAM